jgi:peptidyl-tRNA hydrolase
MKQLLLLGLTALTLGAQTPVTNKVLVSLVVKPGVAREDIMKVMPEEVRATVRLYLAGKIEQWFSRGDGKGVMFIVQSNDVSEAKALMENLPLGKAKYADFEYTPIGPLNPLRMLLGPNPAP